MVNKGHKLSSRLFARVVLGMFLAGVAAAGAFAQGFPSRPINVIYPYTPGSGGDVMARAISTEASKILGQPIIFENRPGANGRLGMNAFNTAQGDGHVLQIVNDGLLVAQPIADPGFRMEAGRNYSPVAVLFDAPFALVSNPAKPLRDMKALVEYARANPGKLNFAVAGGAPSHFLAERFVRAMNIDIVLIPYKGGEGVTTATLAGQTDLMVGQTVKPFVDAGKLVIIATSGKERWSVFPGVSSFAEAGVPFSTLVWYPLIAPPGVSREVVSTLNGAFSRAANAPDMVKRLADIGFSPGRMTPDELAAFIKSEVDAWEPVIRKAGIKL